MEGLEVLSGNRQLKHRLSAGRGLSHAYILAGGPGWGKRTLAAVLARALVCSGDGPVPCGVCPNCRKALAGVHPDIIYVGADGSDINVGAVRAIRSDAYIRPNEAPRKVYVLERAHTMNQSAQNALLKLLEEGLAYAAFLLLTENAGALLPTVRSRCELLSLSPVTEEEARAALAGRFPDLPPAQISEAARRCQGVIGKGVELLEGGGARTDRIRETALQLAGLFAAGSESAALALCVGLEKWEREDLTALLDELVEVVRQGIGTSWTPGRAMALIGRLEELRRAQDFHLGTGHTLGWLCAGWFSPAPINERYEVSP